MSRDMAPVLHRIVEILRQEYDPERIILFGSYVRGQATEDSDIDLLIVKETSKPAVERIVEVSRLLREVQAAPAFVPLDILVSTPQELQQRLDMGDPFYRDVLRDGEVLHERVA